jgi:hypothetical protein
VAYVGANGWLVLVVLWLVLSISKHLSLRRLVFRLKEIDETLWLSMNSPQPTYFRRHADYVNTSPAFEPGRTVPTEFTELSLWLESCRYEKLNDEIIIREAARYKWLDKVMTAVVMAGLCALLISRLVARYAAP